MNRAPRILILTPSLMGADGVSALSRLAVRALHPATRGAPSVTVLSLSESPEDVVERTVNADVRIIGAAGSKLLFGTHAVRAAWNASPAMWVICMHTHLSPAALPLAWRGARLVVTLCGIEAWKPLSALERRALLGAESLLSISEHTAVRFREANPLFRDHRIRACHLGVPDCPTAGAPPDTTAHATALIVGRMAAAERYKGHDLLLDIWPQVIAEIPPARLVIAGDGDDRPRLEARAAQLGLQEHVTFLGRVSDAALADLYRDCAFFVMPSRNEGFGLVFLEAMRAGKACIGAPGAAAEIIRHGETGLLVDPHQPAELLAAMLRLFREPETRARMGRAGAERFAQEFTEAGFQRRFRAILGLNDVTI